MKNFRIESLILAIGLLLLGICIQKGFKSFAERDRSVNVKGLAEMEVPADKVTWPLMYKSLGNDLNALYDNIKNSMGHRTKRFFQWSGKMGERF